MEDLHNALAEIARLEIENKTLKEALTAAVKIRNNALIIGGNPDIRGEWEKVKEVLAADRKVGIDMDTLKSILETLTKEQIDKIVSKIPKQIVPESVTQ